MAILLEGRNSLFPAVPFDGQEFIDAISIKWIYIQRLQGWCRAGIAETVPLADEDIVGLMSAADKSALDSIDQYAGGFGIIADTKLLNRSTNNPSGLILGDIQLVSDSITIDCVIPQNLGVPDSPLIDISQDCQGVQICPPFVELPSSEGELTGIAGTVTGFNRPGLRFRLSDNFLDSFIAEICGCKGNTGDQGPPGLDGQPGTGDGPKGDQGKPGRSNPNPLALKAVVVTDTDNVTDTAVVDIQILPNNKISVTKAKIKLPDSDTPASKVAATPLIRSVNFGDRLTDWSITKAPGDATATNLCLAELPKGGEEGMPQQIVAMTLNDFVEDITSFYQTKLEEFDGKWLQQVKALIESKDAAAKGILGNLAQTLSECEFSQPVEFCLDIYACQTAGGTTGVTGGG